MKKIEPPRHVALTRYIAPLREGGSLPALAEADDGFNYAVKFRGAGHGTKMLVAELIGTELAAAAGLNVPEPVFVDVDADFGRTEGDEEIQDLLRASEGLNLGLHFLSGTYTWDTLVNSTDAFTASKVLWLDAFLLNIDRTVRNTNMLAWRRELWLIDHGASLYFHHSWSDPHKAALSPFPYVKDHAFLRLASELDAADKFMHDAITPDVIDAVVDLVPQEWLADTSDGGPEPDERREAYKTFFKERLANSRIFVEYAKSLRDASL